MEFDELQEKHLSLYSGNSAANVEERSNIAMLHRMIRHNNQVTTEQKFHTLQWQYFNDLKKINKITDIDISIKKDLKTIKENMWGEEKLSALITINTDPKKFTPELLTKVAEEVSTINLWYQPSWSYEFYGEKGEHPHIHMLVKMYKKDPPSTVAQRCMRRLKGKRFKNIVGGDNQIQIDYSTSQHGWDDWVKYIQGDKKEGKQKKVEKDIIWREKYNLHNKYNF